MKHSPTPQQLAFYEAGADPKSGSIALRALAGTGKCLGKDTPVLLASGVIVPVQDIKPGDLLAGPTEPRTVLTTSTGFGELVQIVPTKGDSWICNTDHILTLTGSNGDTGRTIDISVKQYLNNCTIRNRWKKNWKLLRTGVDYWEEADLPIPPYIFGLWIGDGTANQAEFTNQDPVVLAAIQRWATSEGYTYNEKPAHSAIPGEKYQEHCKTVRITNGGRPHPFRQYVRSLSGKWLPGIYLSSSRSQRLELLAGIIDSDGSLSSPNTYEVTFKHEWLAEDLRYLARSLGFAAYTTVKTVSGYKYRRTSISGDTTQIPVRIDYKKATVRLQPKRVTVTGFKIVPLGTGDYYGFTLDGDGRFLLGDFTVTHNTSSLSALARQLPGSGLATSVMRSTTKDLAAVMPANFTTIGLHALGRRAIAAKMTDIKVDNKGNALYEFVKERLSDDEIWWKQLPAIKQLVEQAMLAGIVPEHERFIMEDTPENWESLADHFDIEWSPQIYETARSGLIHLNKQALKGTIQFAHMLTLPLFFGFPLQQFPKLLVDEAQDLNALQHLMLKRALRHLGRAFIVGDPSQAIMAFSGADANSFANLVASFDATILPLTWCWRCGSAIIHEANQYVPELEAPPGAHEGAVLPADYIDLEALPRTIICRNNAPLLALAMRLFAAGFSVECAGRDIGAGLKSTINRVASGKTSDQMRTDEFLSRLHRWAEREVTRRPARKHSVADKQAALIALAEHHRTVGDMRKHIEKLYVNEDDGTRKLAEFQLATIHKAKGREWDRVGFLDAHLLPAKWAKQDWERVQENNLSYVAVTRAKQELVYLNSEMIQ